MYPHREYQQVAGYQRLCEAELQEQEGNNVMSVAESEFHGQVV